MPLYEYAPNLLEGETPRACCSFETLQQHSEPPLTHCPNCNHAIHRAVSTFGVSGCDTSNPSHTGNEISKNAHSIRMGNSAGHNTTNNTTNSTINTSNTAAGRVIQNAMGHVCRAGCKH